MGTVGESTTTLTLILDDTKVIVNDGTDGYFDNIDKKYDGVYNISDINGKTNKQYRLAY